MYLVLIGNDAKIEINGIEYSFVAGGQDNNKSGTFVFKTDDATAGASLVTISMPEATVLHRSDSLKEVVEILVEAL